MRNRVTYSVEEKCRQKATMYTSIELFFKSRTERKQKVFCDGNRCTKTFVSRLFLVRMMFVWKKVQVELIKFQVERFIDRYWLLSILNDSF